MGSHFIFGTLSPIFTGFKTMLPLAKALLLLLCTFHCKVGKDKEFIVSFKGYIEVRIVVLTGCGCEVRAIIARCSSTTTKAGSIQYSAVKVPFPLFFIHYRPMRFKPFFGLPAWMSK